MLRPPRLFRTRLSIERGGDSAKLGLCRHRRTSADPARISPTNVAGLRSASAAPNEANLSLHVPIVPPLAKVSAHLFALNAAHFAGHKHAIACTFAVMCYSRRLPLDLQAGPSPRVISSETPPAWACSSPWVVS